jgi:IS30 family transposase
MRWQFFDRVCAGESLREAGRQVGVSIQQGWKWWHDAGAMQLRSGTGSDTGLAERGDRDRPGGWGHRLSFDERLTIMRGRDQGLSQVQIAAEIGRDPSVISRELRRNRNPDGDYHAGLAHGRAAQKAKRPKVFKLIGNPVCASIEAWMDDGWSPRLIAQMLARDHPDDRLARVSHETIYKCLYVQTRGSLRADLHNCLSTKRAARKSRGRTDNRRGAYSSGQEFRISDRPAEAADRAVPGHWESQWCCQAA